MAKALVAIVVCLSFIAPVLAAAPAQPKAVAARPKPAKPEWGELTPAQQNVLAPLKDDWASLDTTRRKKWVKVANAYPKMKPEQRRAARAKYQTIKKLSPEKRAQVKAQWEQYQQSLAAAKPNASGQDVESGASAQQ